MKKIFANQKMMRIFAAVEYLMCYLKNQQPMKRIFYGIFVLAFVAIAATNMNVARKFEQSAKEIPDDERVSEDSIMVRNSSCSPWLCDPHGGNEIYTINGLIGIGISSGTAKLHVVGETILNGAVSIGGYSNVSTNLHVVGNSNFNLACIGRSGTTLNNYEFGYNVGFTNTNNTYTYRTADMASSINMGTGGNIVFKTAVAGSAGATMTLTERIRIANNGNVGIGTSSPIAKLHVVGTTHLNGHVNIGTASSLANLIVAGNINARSVNVTANAGADFVFEPDYRLRTLAEVEQFIIENKHLPDIAPAECMVRNGVDIGEFQIQLLQKIEELTLYVIELKKEIDELKK